MNEQLDVLSLFSGIGGIDLALEAVGMRVVAQCEIDKPCREVLASHWPDVPCLEDVRDVGSGIDLRPDVVAAGFPCQPVSQAGRRLAQEDSRWLWPEVARVVRELGPRYVFLENVRGLLRRGFHDVITDLAGLGFDVEWGVLRASDVGTPHRRERVFILAASPDSCGLGLARLAASDSENGELDEQPGREPDGRDLAPADSGSTGRRQDAGGAPGDEVASAGGGRERRSRHWRCSRGLQAAASSDAGSVARTQAGEREVGPGKDGEQTARGRAREAQPGAAGCAGDTFDWGVYADAVRRWQLIRGDIAPIPSDEQGRLMPEFVEWMMGYEIGWTFGSRTQRLKQLGNSVVPQCVLVPATYLAGVAHGE